MASTLLLKNAKIVDPNSRHHGKERDIFIRNGKIELVKAKITVAKVKEIDLKGACVSPGWLDVGVQVGDPGFEHREDLDTVASSAAAGGYCLSTKYNACHTLKDRSCLSEKPHKRKSG